MMPATRRQFLRGLGAVTALGALGGLQGCSGSSSDEDLELFQFKSEAITFFDTICRQFSQQHPAAAITQNFVADNITGLRVRLVKNNMPPAITINGDYNFGDLARTGVFADFSGTDVYKKVNPSVGQILGTLGRGGNGQINGLPLANNGSGVIYNRDVFEKHSVEPPKTWDEFIAVCDKLKAAGVDPFCWGFKDNWTGAPMFNSISGGFLTGGVAAWYEKRRKREVTFADGLRPVMTKMKTLASYGNRNKFEIGYNDANQAFSKGTAAMYLHGTYSIPAIRSYNPKIQLGTFATPADDEKNTKVVSGVDVALTMPVEPDRRDDVMAFFDYLMSEPVMTRYCKAQVAYPTLTGTTVTDPALTGLAPYFAAQRVATYSDHNFPPAINLNAYMQQFLIKGDVDAFARTLDTQWDKVINRLNRTQ
ncbi:MAG: ABC transporter substrate-binding protein [Acidipropionibacterium acidipropionici]|jgi:raffinose/stachyose/melibiose transport system substrate-binding protein|uniref:ABC transporter substrate-binding protein n=1 Tax=Acidipropionibacterium acidipropionici TaxID=1748 RepID=UPI002F35586A